MPGIADIFRLALQLLVNLTDQQKEYIKWRCSDEGKKHFDRVEENRFYNALLDGDTSIVDAGIAEKQERIRKLKESLGLAILLAMFCVGCSQVNPLKIPDGIPDKTTAGLKSTERTYLVENIEINVPGKGPQVLEGKWHIVSQDFMLDHIRNQDDLINALGLAKDAKAAAKRISLWVGIGGCIWALATFLWIRTYRPK